jgi:hypothetical protein
MEFQIAAVAPDFEVIVESEPWRVAPQRDAAIERICRARVGALPAAWLDEGVLAHVRSDRRRLVARIARRRDVLAGRFAPELFDGAPPRSVAVAARVAIRGRIVLGRRSAAHDEQPGRWELAPACALDGSFLDRKSGRVDFAGQLLAELVEQTPLPRPPRAAVRPFALAWSAIDPTWTVCTAIELDAGEDAVREIESARTARYDAFRVARPVDVIEAGLWDGDELVPLTSALVRLPRSEPQAA